MISKKNLFRALIVDDERLARKELISMLTEYDNIYVSGEAEDVPSAISQIKETKPDIIFLDIQMPGKSGFDLLNEIKIEAKIIFVTAYDEYAIRAFEVNAVDYLLKPVSHERLRSALERLQTGPDEETGIIRNLKYDDRLFLTLDSQLQFFKVSSILSICSAGDYSEMNLTENMRGLTSKSMKEWEERLPEEYFCRIHRSTIINLEYVEKLEEWFNNSFRVYIKGIKDPYLLSRRYAAKLKAKFS